MPVCNSCVIFPMASHPQLAAHTLPHSQYTPRSQDLTPAQFLDQFERPRRPVIITGATDGWGAHRNWLPEVLAIKYRDHKFKVGLGADCRRC